MSKSPRPVPRRRSPSSSRLSEGEADESSLTSSSNTDDDSLSRNTISFTRRSMQRSMSEKRPEEEDVVFEKAKVEHTKVRIRIYNIINLLSICL